MSLAENITRRRTELGLTQADLARLTNVSQPRISDLERGASLSPRLPFLVALAHALQTTVDELVR